jgi:hypothetical protein
MDKGKPGNNITTFCASTAVVQTQQTVERKEKEMLRPYTMCVVKGARQIFCSAGLSWEYLATMRQLDKQHQQPQQQAGAGVLQQQHSVACLLACPHNPGHARAAQVRQHGNISTHVPAFSLPANAQDSECTQPKIAAMPCMATQFAQTACHTKYTHTHTKAQDRQQEVHQKEPQPCSGAQVRRSKLQ